MTATALLLQQRSKGEVTLRVEQQGVTVLREAGSAKCRMPRGSREAMLINTSGGLAGGDVVDIRAEAGVGASLTLTTQTAERVYRTLGPAAEVSVLLAAEGGASLFWLPQETILFENSALQRRLAVELAADSRFLAVESLVFGRQEMGEHVRHVSVSDHWQVRRAGRLVHAEAFRLGPDWVATPATTAANRAFATLLFLPPQGSLEAENALDTVRQHLGPDDGASAWNGKLIARLMAKDGFTLRKALIQVVAACLGSAALPKTWTR